MSLRIPVAEGDQNDKLSQCLRFHAIPTRIFEKPSYTLYQEDGVLKRPVLGHIFGAVLFAQNGVGPDIFLIFTLLPEIRLSMLVSFKDM